jgi:hypothetical protein
MRWLVYINRTSPTSPTNKPKAPKQSAPTTHAPADIRDVGLALDEALGAAKVADFEDAGLGVDEEVLGLDVAVADARGVDEGEGAEELVCEELDEEDGWEGVLLVVGAADAVHGLGDVLENEVEEDVVTLGALVPRVEVVAQRDDVRVAQGAHDGELPVLRTQNTEASLMRPVRAAPRPARRPPSPSAARPARTLNRRSCRTFFTATRSPVSTTDAKKTTPNEPFPSTRSVSYRSVGPCTPRPPPGPPPPPLRPSLSPRNTPPRPAPAASPTYLARRRVRRLGRQLRVHTRHPNARHHPLRHASVRHLPRVVAEAFSRHSPGYHPLLSRRRVGPEPPSGCRMLRPRQAPRRNANRVSCARTAEPRLPHDPTAGGPRNTPFPPSPTAHTPSPASTR